MQGGGGPGKLQRKQSKTELRRQQRELKVRAAS